MKANELNRLYGPDGIMKEEGETSFVLHSGNMYTILNKNVKVAGPLIRVFAKMLKALGEYIPIEKKA